MRRALLLVPLAGLAACNSEIELQSNRAPSYEGNPRRVLVVAANQLFPGSGPDVIAPAVAQRLARCGITAEAMPYARPAGTLPLDDPPNPSDAQVKQLAARQAAFRPDTVMLVKSTGLEALQRTSSGVRSTQILRVRYDVQLLDVVSQRTAYRAAVNLRLAPLALTSPPLEFAQLLVQKMADDSVIQGCPPPTALPS